MAAQLAAAMPAAAKGSRKPRENSMRLSPEPQEAETPPRSARRKRRSKAASGSELSGGLAREVSVMQRLSDRLATAAGAEEQLAQERVARERPSRAAAPRATD